MGAGPQPGPVGRLFGNGTNSGRHEASPESAYRVECRWLAISHPKVLPGRCQGIRPLAWRRLFSLAGAAAGDRGVPVLDVAQQVLAQVLEEPARVGQPGTRRGVR